MKRIVLFVLMLVSVAAISQPANYLNIRSRYNLIAVKTDSGFHVPGYSTIPNYRGGVWTGAGNVGVDTVNHKFYFYSGGSWREAGATYTFTNGLTESGGVVKLGGVLSNNTIIGGDSVYFSFSNIDSVLFKNGNSGGGITLEPSRNGTVSKITLTNDEGLKMLIRTGDGYLETLSGFYIRNESDNSALSINAKSGGQEAPLIEVIEGVETIFLIDDDSFHLKPNLGNLYIDSLNTVSSTTGRKVLVHDTATGKIERIDFTNIADTSYTTIATFTAGGGFASDTTMCTDSTLFGSFYTGQFNYTIAYVQAVIKGNAGDSIVLKLVYNDSFNVDGTKVNGAGLSVNNRYKGNTFTISTNRTVPANTWLWMKPEAVIAGKKPKYISVTLVGYKTYVAP